MFLKTPEERRVLDRLYSTFFKIPMFIVQYNTATKNIPTLRELSEQFNFTVPGEADVILRIMEADPRVPKFIERNPKTGEITRVDIDAVNAKKYGFTFTLAHLNGETQQAYGGVSVFPTMFFVDKTGTIVRHFVNFQEKPVLEAAIQQTLGK